MNQSPGPESKPAPERRGRWVRISLTAGSVIVLAGAGSFLAGWVFLNERLSPILARQLSRTLDRPVEVGELERLTLSKVRFGPSSLPPTETDADTATLGAIEVRFNLLQLFSRELRLDIDLKQADVYVEQAADGQWLDINIEPPKPEDPEPFIEVKPGTIRFSDSQLTMLPYIPAAVDVEPSQRSQDADQVTLTAVSGDLRFSDADLETPDDAEGDIQAQQIAFDLQGDSVRQGRLEVSGTAILPPASVETGPQVKLGIQAEALQATDIMPLVRSFWADLPVDVTTGLLSGNATLEYAPQTPFTITGTARVSEGTVAVRRLPLPIEAISGQMRFQGRQIAFEQVSAELGDLTAQAGGTLDWRSGYDFSGQLAPFTIAQVSDLFDVDLPLDTEGNLTADVKMTGQLADPVVTADITAPDGLIVDKVDFAQVEAQARYQGQTITVDQLAAQPAAGGQLTGRGRYRLTQPGQISLTATGTGLPADAIASAYGLPDAITWGPLALQADISGAIGELQGLISWRAPTGDYPARGTIDFAGSSVNFRDTVVTVAGGTVRGNGQLSDGRWQADLQAQGIQLAQLSDNLRGSAAGSAQLSGRLDDVSTQGIRGQGQLDLAIAGGSINGQASLADGRWQADLQGEGIQLAQFSDNLQGSVAGQLALSGRVDALTLADIQGTGQLVASDGLATAAPLAPRLAAVQAPLTASVSWDGRQITLNQAQTAGIQASGTITPRLGAGPAAIDNVDLDLQINNYALAALPLPEAVEVGGSASFQGQLTGPPERLQLVGNAQLVDLALSDLEFESPLTGPVRVALDDGVDVNLQGTQQDAIQVSYGFDQRRLRFNVRADEARAQGQTEGDIFRAEVENFPLAALNLPPGGVPGFGTVRGTVETAQITADLSRSLVQAEVALLNPGLGYLSIRGTPSVVDGIEQETASRFEGSFTYANGTAALTNGRLTTGNSLYQINARYQQQGEPALRGQIAVERGQIQDILTTLQFFQISDLGRGFSPPEWARDYSPQELQMILDTMTAGNPQGSFLDQLRRVSELLELQDQEALAESGSALPPLADLRGEFSGNILLAGSLPADIEVDFQLAGDDWRWGPNYRVDTVIAEGSFAEGILQLSPLRLASARENANSFLDVSGAVAFNDEDATPRTLSFEAENIPIQPVQAALRLPASLDGRLNADATFSGPLKNPQLRGAFNIAQATINEKPVQAVTANFLYQNARLNLNSELVVENPEDPLTLKASVPYRLPFAQQVPASDRLQIDIDVRDEGLLLVNLLNRQVTLESGGGSLELAIRGRWPDGTAVPDVGSLDLTGEAQLEDVILSARVLPQPLTDINGSLRFRDDRVIVERLRGRFSEGELLAQGTFPILLPLDQRGDAIAPPDPRSSGPEATATATPTQPSDLRRPDPDQVPADVDRLPLVVDLSQTDLSFKGIYQGQVDGRVQLGGSAVLYGPTLAGAVVLSDGVLSLPESGFGGGNGSASVVSNGEGGGPPVRLDDFTLFLQEGTRIQAGGIVDVAAQGSIVTNGIFPNLQPQGRVKLPSGQINLLTTEFRLRGGDNYAEFRPSLGLEPYLQATLQASVPDTVGSGATSLTTASPFPRNEISDANTDQLGLNRSGIETVRIRAEVEGPAFQVAQLRGVTLRSTPARSEGEIISLISGGVLTALESTLGSVGGEGDSFEGLLTLAGSTLLNQVQGILGESLNLSELRLYSATPESAQGSGSSVDIGGEIGFEISPDLSLSIQKTFTDITPFQFNVRYRINNQFTLRGTTSYEDFTENSGLLLEYETRF